jgi:2'-5' RNA ligase
MSEKLRLFVAVNLPDDLRSLIGSFQAGLRKQVRGVKWVKEENLHLTVKFLTDVDSRLLPELRAALDKALIDRAPFTATLRGAGVFPPRGRPRVVWLDLPAGGDRIAVLQKDVEWALAPLGFAPEQRSFTPHLTVGRVKDRGDPASLNAALAAAQDRKWGDFVVEKVHLMRSELFPTGPRYSILHVARLTP